MQHKTYSWRIFKLLHMVCKYGVPVCCCLDRNLVGMSIDRKNKNILYTFDLDQLQLTSPFVITLQLPQGTKESAIHRVFF